MYTDGCKKMDTQSNINIKINKYISKTRQSCRPSSWCLKPTKQQTEKNVQTHVSASFPFSHSLIGCSLKNDQKKLQSYSPEKMLEANAEIKIEFQVSMIFLCCHFPLPISMRFAACGPYIQLRDFFNILFFPVFTSPVNCFCGRIACPAQRQTTIICSDSFFKPVTSLQKATLSFVSYCPRKSTIPIKESFVNVINFFTESSNKGVNWCTMAALTWKLFVLRVSWEVRGIFTVSCPRFLVLFFSLRRIGFGTYSARC